MVEMLKNLVPQSADANHSHSSGKESPHELHSANLNFILINTDGKGIGNRESSGQANGANLMTRLSKIEFPRFDGKMLKEWLYKCEQFFILD